MSYAPQAERRQAQLLVVLSPEGGIAVELPGANGSRRKVTMPTDPAAAMSCLRSMLLAQQAEGAFGGKIGSRSAPTQWDIDRWSSVAQALAAPVGTTFGDGTAVVTKYSGSGTALPTSPDDIGL